jgi:hypothetical protein
MLRRATKALLDTDFRPVLSRLRALAVGAFYGHEQELAQASCLKIEEWRGYRRLLMSTQASFAGIIATTESLDHYCQCPRDAPLKCDTFSRSVLVYPYGLPAPYFVNPPSISFHSRAIPHTRLHLTFGAPAKWYYHQAQWNGTVDHTTIHFTAEYSSQPAFAPRSSVCQEYWNTIQD